MSMNDFWIVRLELTYETGSPVPLAKQCLVKYPENAFVEDIGAIPWKFEALCSMRAYVDRTIFGQRFGMALDKSH
jgi:hypothetical protein